MYMTKPTSSFVVIEAEAGRVLAMFWKEGNILDSTTFTARPPQKAWIPKLIFVNNLSLVYSERHVWLTRWNWQSTSASQRSSCHTCRKLPDSSLEIPDDIGPDQMSKCAFIYYSLRTHTRLTANKRYHPCDQWSDQHHSNGLSSCQAICQIARTLAPSGRIYCSSDPANIRILNLQRTAEAFLPEAKIPSQVIVPLFKRSGDDIPVRPSIERLLILTFLLHLPRCKCPWNTGFVTSPSKRHHCKVSKQMIIL